MIFYSVWTFLTININNIWFTNYTSDLRGPNSRIVSRDWICYIGNWNQVRIEFDTFETGTRWYIYIYEFYWCALISRALGAWGLSLTGRWAPHQGIEFVYQHKKHSKWYIYRLVSYALSAWDLPLISRWAPHFIYIWVWVHIGHPFGKVGSSLLLDCIIVVSSHKALRFLK